MEVSDQPFDAESLGDSEDADLVPIQSGEDWVAQLDDDLSPSGLSGRQTFPYHRLTTRGYHLCHIVGVDPVRYFSRLGGG